MILDKCKNPIFINGNWQSCGKCAYCKAKRQLEWTIRGKHEALEHQGDNMLFVTLTYNQEHLPIGAKKPENPNDCMGTLVKEHVTNFLKRLRFNLNGKKIKYILSGEYGGSDKKNGKWRPHYHLIIYGIGHKDISQYKLTKIWGKGNAYIDKKPFVNTQAIAYTVGYINKKMSDTKSHLHYEDNGRVAPFQRQSQGIGKDWLEKNEKVYKNLKTGYNGNTCSIPRYYIKKIYETEGRKVRIDNIVHTQYITGASKYDIENKDYFIFEDKYYHIIDKIHISKNYKVFKNPNGTKTAEILRQLHENALKTIENAQMRYGISDADKARLRAKKAAQLQEEMNRYISEWQDACTMTDEELRNKYIHETFKIINLEKISLPYKNNDYDRQTLKEMIKEASRKNKIIQERIDDFHRDGEDLNEEILKFIQNFK